MNKKQWEKYNSKIAHKSMTNANKQKTKAFCKKYNIKLLKHTPKQDEHIYHELQVSEQNVLELQEKAMHELYKATKGQAAAIDFEIELSSDKNASRGSVGLKVYDPILHINIERKFTHNGYIHRIWYRDVFTYDPSVSSDKAKTGKYHHATKINSWLSLKAVGYIQGMLDKFMTIPNVYRQMNWIGHHYVTKK